MNKNSIPTSHRTIYLTIIQIKLLMLFTELIGIFCENYILVFIVISLFVLCFLHCFIYEYLFLFVLFVLV